MSLQVSASTLKPAQVTADVLIIPLYDDIAISKSIPETLRRRIGTNLRRLEFACAWGTAILFPVFKGSKAPFVAIIGLGKRDVATTQHAEALRRGLGSVVQEARKHGLKSLSLAIPDADSAVEFTRGAVEGTVLANYRFTEYAQHIKQEHASRAVKHLMIVTTREVLQAVRDEIKAALQVTEGALLARDLVNQPASSLTPATLVAQAQAIANAGRNSSVRIFDRKEAEKEGFTAFLAVARGSLEEPYVIHLTYRPSLAKRKIFIVGKGITFDSGGLSLKPAEMMEGMKSDMAGAATVLGLFSVLEKFKPDIEVHGIIAACENMPSGTAYRPGDILHAKNGKTIEVLNTDAEGRITLADALTYAVEQGADVIIDLATLTGACMVALGETYAGLWSNDEALQHELEAAAAVTGENLCALPLPPEYKPFIQSKVADLRNIATNRYGGAITAALFLQEFVNDVPWAHVDIAGPSFMERPCVPYYPAGGTGYGVRLLMEYLQQQSIEQA